jgi:hypothetical protein
VANQVTDTVNNKNKVLALRAAVGVGALGALALLGKVIWAAAGGALGLIAVGVLGVIGVGLFQSIPLLGQKWENALLAARKKEAREHPLEQIQNLFIFRRERLALFRNAVVKVGAGLESMADMIDERKKAKPGYDATKHEKSLALRRGAHAKLVKVYKDAETALEQTKELIEDKKFDWEFGQAGKESNALMHSLNGEGGQGALDNILADEAFASIRDNFNLVFAEMELEATKLTNMNEISLGDGLTLDMTSITIPSIDKVRA